MFKDRGYDCQDGGEKQTKIGNGRGLKYLEEKNDWRMSLVLFSQCMPVLFLDGLASVC